MTSTARPTTRDSTPPRETGTAETAEQLNGEIVQLLFGTLDRLRDHFSGAAAEIGLSGGPAKALANLSEPTPMRQLASVMACDPSNITGIVDDLERRGLLTRESDPRDRRIKLLVLTKQGQRTQQEFLTRLNRTVPGISELTERQRRTLRDLLKLVA